MAENTDRRGDMEEAFGSRDVPALMPAGPQQVLIDERPRGAMKLEVKRDLGQVLKNIKVTAQAAGDDFFYRWPVKVREKQPDGSYQERTDWVEGPSVKCTNAVARLFGNCGVQMRAIDQGDHWLLYARFTDFETGFFLERPFQQRKAQNIGGKMDSARAQDIVFQIGVSKATRNVVANALAEQVDYAFVEAKEAIVGKIGKEPDKYRARLRQRLEELRIDPKRVERRVGRTMDRWLVPDMALVVAEIQAINDGMAHPDEMWPAEPIQAPARPTEATVTAGPQQADNQKPAEDKTGADTAKTVSTEASGASEGASASVPAEEQEEEDTPPSPAWVQAEETVARLEKSAREDPRINLDEFKKLGRLAIDALGGLTEDERDELRARFTTFVLGLQKERGGKKKSK